MNIHQLNQKIIEILGCISDGNSESESRWILEKISGVRGAALFFRDFYLSDEQEQLCLEIAHRRRAGEPLQYLLGETEFRGLRLEVGSGVLIPRLETEQLVDLALEFLFKRWEENANSGSLRGLSVCDLCTGSGAIILGIASACGQKVSRAVGVDISEAALAYALKNVAITGLAVDLYRGDLYEPLNGERFDLITANPPYVTEDEYTELSNQVRDYEPHLALVGAENGLGVIKRIVEVAPDFLFPGGMLLLEIGENQGAAVSAILRKTGFIRVSVVLDLQKRERFVLGYWH